MYVPEYIFFLLNDAFYFNQTNKKQHRLQYSWVKSLNGRIDVKLVTYKWYKNVFIPNLTENTYAGGESPRSDARDYGDCVWSWDPAHDENRS